MGQKRDLVPLAAAGACGLCVGVLLSLVIFVVADIKSHKRANELGSELEKKRSELTTVQADVAKLKDESLRWQRTVVERDRTEDELKTQIRELSDQLLKRPPDRPEEPLFDISAEAVVAAISREFKIERKPDSLTPTYHIAGGRVILELNEANEQLKSVFVMGAEQDIREFARVIGYIQIALSGEAFTQEELKWLAESMDFVSGYPLMAKVSRGFDEAELEVFMIRFQGERLFFVGFKPSAPSPILTPGEGIKA